MQGIYRMVLKAAENLDSVIIIGEKGVGKKTCAEAIHFYSGKNPDSFYVALDQSDLEQFLQSKQQGTIFCMNASQGTIEFLDQLNCSVTNLKIIASTTDNYKSSLLKIKILPLRKRKEDVVDLAQYYLDSFCSELKIAPKDITKSALTALNSYDWPGNISELKNLMRSISAEERNEYVTAHCISKYLKITAPRNTENHFEHISLTLKKIEEHAIKQAINLCNGNIAHAAKILDISPSTIYRKMRNWDKN